MVDAMGAIVGLVICFIVLFLCIVVIGQVIITIYNRHKGVKSINVDGQMYKWREK